MALLVDKLIPEQFGISGNVFIHKPVMISSPESPFYPSLVVGCIIRALTVWVGDSCFSMLRAEMVASVLSFGAGPYLIFFPLLASIENTSFKPTLCFDLLLSQCIPRDSTSEMRWNKWLQRLLPWCIQSVLLHGHMHVAVKIAIERNKHCPIHLVFRIRLNDFIFSQIKKLSSEFKHA